MLILTRKIGESILVGDDIEVFLTEITKGAARIGINAPRNMPVYRKEIYDRIKEENEVASSTIIDDSQFEKLNALIAKKIIRAE